jgi:hypothetical protein
VQVRILPDALVAHGTQPAELVVLGCCISNQDLEKTVDYDGAGSVSDGAKQHPSLTLPALKGPPFIGIHKPHTIAHASVRKAFASS